MSLQKYCHDADLIGAVMAAVAKCLMRGDCFSIQDANTIRIGIGGWCVTSSGEQLTTLLGSCVAVCLFDQDQPIAGMNHILLPGDADLQRANSSARYGVNAMELLINGLMRAGGSRKRLAAKVMGGASILPDVSEVLGMGARNIHFVKEFLALEKIPILASHLGGQHARRIYFNTITNEVLLKRIKPVFEGRLREQEAQGYKDRKTVLKMGGGEVDLFP